MSAQRRSIIPIFITSLLLAGLGADAALRPRQSDAEPYHRRVAEIAAKLPIQVGNWRGEDQEVARAAIRLLRPNVIIQRTYTHRGTGQRVHFLLVQCKDAQDMAGHYPPICYRNQGWEMRRVDGLEFRAGDQQIPVRQYMFEQMILGQVRSQVIINFMIMPNGTIGPDIQDVYAAARSYLRKFHGAAQVQLVLEGQVPEQQCRNIFAELVGAAMPIVDVIRSGGSTPR